MTEKRLLALIALLIGLVGGLLILNEAVRGFRGVSDLAAILSALVPLVLGIAILAASLLIYRSKYGFGRTARHHPRSRGLDPPVESDRLDSLDRRRRHRARRVRRRSLTEVKSAAR